jgi:hypothetical protein
MPNAKPGSRLLLRKLASISLMRIAGLLWCIFVYGLFSGELGAIGGALVGGIGASAAYQGVRLFNRARQLETATIKIRSEAKDNRPRVLYLRSFNDDAVTAGTVSGGLALGGLAVKTEEEQLAKIVNTIGPVVSVGKPGEELPELGSRRIYLRSEEWKEHVT